MKTDPEIDASTDADADTHAGAGTPSRSSEALHSSIASSDADVTAAGRWLLALAVVAAAYCVWLLLLPMDFVDEQVTAFLSERLVRKVNTAANVLLFSPLGLTIAWWLRSRGRGGTLIPLTIVICASISLSCEWAQVHLPSRASSLIDLLANITGAGVGAAVGLMTGKCAIAMAARFHHHLQRYPALHRTMWTVLAATVVRLWPLDISPEVEHLKEQLARTKASLSPFRATRHWLVMDADSVMPAATMRELTSAGVTSLLMLLVCTAIGRFRREQDEIAGATGWRRSTLGWSAIVLAATELLQLPIRERVMDATDLAAGGLAIGAAMLWQMAAGDRGRTSDDAANAGVAHPAVAAPHVGQSAAGAATGAANVVAIEAVEPSPRAAAATTPTPATSQVALPISNRQRVHAACRAAIVGVGLALLAGALATWAVRHPAVPYNIRELAGSTTLSSWLRLSSLAATVLWIGAAPTALGRILLRRKRGLIDAFTGLGAIALAGALICCLAAPREAVADIVGTPIAGAGWWAESMLRLAAFLLGPASVMLGGMVICRLSRIRMQGQEVLAAKLLIAAAFGLLLSRWVVFDLAATDNITELVKPTGDWLLAMPAVVFGVTASCIGATIGPRVAWRPIKTAGALLLIAPAAWFGFVVFRLATVDDLEKYGLTFSASQFLLGANRESTLTTGQLFGRWCIAIAAACIVGGMGAGIGHWALPLAGRIGRISPPKETEPRPRHV